MISIMLLLRVSVALIFVLLIDRALVIDRLRKAHNETWLSLGAPSVFRSGKSGHELLRFMGFRGAVSKIDDRVLTALVAVHRLALVLIILAFAGVIGLAAVGKG